MTERRAFLQSALATCAFASMPLPQPLPPVFPGEVRESLAQALSNSELAAKLAPVLLDVGSTWRPPTQPASSFHAIVAYSFGNRAPLPGSSRPAPGQSPAAEGRRVELPELTQGTLKNPQLPVILRSLGGERPAFLLM